jgi:hypothetical protein
VCVRVRVGVTVGLAAVGWAGPASSGATCMYAAGAIHTVTAFARMCDLWELALAASEASHREVSTSKGGFKLWG